MYYMYMYIYIISIYPKGLMASLGVPEDKFAATCVLIDKLEKVIYVCTYVCTYVYVYIYTRMYMDMYTYLCSKTCMHIYIYIYTYMYIAKCVLINKLEKVTTI
jgi:hypothetical protein